MISFQFPVIDKELTGEKLRGEFKKKNISAREVQEFLCLGSTQTVYDWYKGRTLPSLDNMVALSRLLGCQVEELLIFVQTDAEKNIQAAEE